MEFKTKIRTNFETAMESKVDLIISMTSVLVSAGEQFSESLSRKKAKTLERFRVLSVTKDGEDLPFTFATAGLEAWGGEVRVHAMVVFPYDPKKRALFDGKKFAARLLFEK